MPKLFYGQIEQHLSTLESGVLAGENYIEFDLKKDAFVPKGDHNAETISKRRAQHREEQDAKPKKPAEKAGRWTGSKGNRR